MKFRKNLFCPLTMIVFLCLFACDTNSQNSQFKSVSFSQAGCEFSIVSAYLNMTIFIDEAKENRKNSSKLYNKYVYGPIWKNFASDGEYSFLAESIKSPITDLETLSEEVEILSGSGVEDIVKEALLKVSGSFPDPDTDIYLLAIDPNYKQYTPKKLIIGMMAHTFGAGRILLLIDPTISGWQKILPKVVAHEYYHSAWTSRNFETKDFSVLEYLIFEGRADVFAEMMYPDIKAPWTNLFGSEKEKSVWYEMKRFLKSRDAQVVGRMSSGDKNIPIGSVYTIGFRIVQEFIKNNPDITMLEWTDVTAEDILANSRYEDRFEGKY